MKSSVYWPQRQEELAAALEKDEAALKRRLLRQYEAEAAKLEREIAAYYKRYGEDNIVKYADLFKKLPDSDIMLLIQRMDEFEKKYPEYADLMPIRESIYKLNRLEGLQQSIRLQQRELGAITNRELKEHLASLAYKSTGAADKIMGLAVNSSAMKLFSGTAWSGEADFSQRIWQNTDKLADYLNNDIANGFARGDSYERLIKNVRSRFINVAKNDAYRLIYTEGTYVMNESSAAVFAEDFEDYEFQVADNNACPVCKALNGKKFKFSQRVPGRNFPPMHPWCRCHYGVAVADWDKWQDEYVKKHGGNVSQNTLNGLYNSFNQSDLIPITPEAIQNIKSFDLPELGWRENQQLIVAMRKLLERVKNVPLGTEYLHYYDMHMNFLREHPGKEGIGKVEDNFHPMCNYMTIHNHPDGGTFSPGDIDRLVENENLQMIIAVGNNGKQYLMSKTKDFAGRKFVNDYMDYMEKAKEEVEDLDTFISKANEFIKTKGAKYGYRYKEK